MVEVRDQRSIVIIGGGLSGLSLGAYIKDGGFNSIILEQSNKIGGVLQTIEKDGFLLELGANTTSTSPALEEIIAILGLQNEVIRPNINANKRYILKNNKLKQLSPTFSKILFSTLLSLPAKIAIFKEQFKAKNEDYKQETVGEFFERRFNREIVDTIVNPMIAGIYAGDPYLLSMQSVFPQVAQMEQEYGSVLKGLKAKKGEMKREVITFKNGMQTLIKGFEHYIGKENILTETKAKSVTPLQNGQFAIQLLQDGLELEIIADVVVFATPSYVTSEFIRPISPELADLMKLHYPKMGVIHVGYPKSALKKQFNGFGFLVPEKEHKHFLGAIANSSFLPNRAPNDMELFTIFAGGVRQEHLLASQGSTLLETAVKEFEAIMEISEKPVLYQEHIWEHSIPQYDMRHTQMLEGFQFFESNVDNLHILGNYRSGVSIADCVSGAKRAHGKLIKDYSIQSYRKLTQIK